MRKLRERHGAAAAALEALEPQKIAVVAVSGEGFVASFSRQKNLDMLPGQLGHIVQGNGWRLAHGLFHMPNVLRHESCKIGGGDGHFMMTAAELFGSQLSVGSLVRNPWTRKPDGVTANLLVRSVDRKTKHRRGIHSAAEQDPNGNVCNHVQLYCFRQQT